MGIPEPIAIPPYVEKFLEEALNVDIPDDVLVYFLHPEVQGVIQKWVKYVDDFDPFLRERFANFLGHSILKPLKDDGTDSNDVRKALAWFLAVIFALDEPMEWRPKWYEK